MLNMTQPDAVIPGPGGEMPAASAAVIYFIRTAVISSLQEFGQRQLLSALGAVPWGVCMQSRLFALS